MNGNNNDKKNSNTSGLGSVFVWELQSAQLSER